MPCDDAQPDDVSEITCEGGEESISNNATAPTPAIAPGIEDMDARRAGEEVARSHQGLGIDPRIPALVPGFDAPFYQAGLAGYSDAAMRLMARKHGCPFCVTEALLDRTLLAGGRGFAKADLGEIHDNVPGGEDDHPLAGQIMGSDPREMAAAALKMIEQGTRSDRAYRELAYVDGKFPDPGEHLRLPGGLQISIPAEPGSGRSSSNSVGPASGRFSSPRDAQATGRRPVPLTHDDGSSPAHLLPCSPAPLPFQAIDVNLACPVKKIKAKARGGHWLAEPEGAIRILEAVREAVPKEIPCTVKLRRSFDDTPEMAENLEKIFAAAYDIGYAWTTVHARTVVQKYVGPSRWTFLKELRRRHPDKIFFGSGDIWRAEDIFLMIRYTGVSGVSVARGCIGNPWIFTQARSLMRGQPPRPPTIAEQRAVLDEHFRLLVAVNGTMRPGSPKVSPDGKPTWSERHAARLMRKFGVRFSVHHPRADSVRIKMIGVKDMNDWRGVLEEYYREPVAMCGTTQMVKPLASEESQRSTQPQ